MSVVRVDPDLLSQKQKLDNLDNRIPGQINNITQIEPQNPDYLDDYSYIFLHTTYH